MARIDINEKLLLDAITKVDLRISVLTSKLGVKGGRLLSDSISLSSAINLRKDIAKQFGPYYAAAATATDYVPAQKEVGKILKDAGISSKFTKADTSLVKAFSDDGLNQLTALGNQYSADISKKVYTAVAAGDSLDDLTLEIRQLLIGGTDKGGRPMVDHAQTIATTGYQEVDSILLKTKTDDIPDDEIEFKYAGSLIKDSRKWCVDHVNKTYTRAEIAAWESSSWKGKKSGDPFVARGGWNCRHRWLPVLVGDDIRDMQDSSHSALNDEMEKEYENWNDSLTANEFDTVREYRDKAYRPMNNHLRRGEKATKETKEMIDTMDSILDNNILSQDTKMYRGLSLDIDSIDDLIGSTIEDKGFTSMTLDPDVADIFSEFGKRSEKETSILMELNVKEGSKGAYINNRKESEFILQRGSNVKIISARENPDREGAWIIKGEMI